VWTGIPSWCSIWNVAFLSLEWQLSNMWIIWVRYPNYTTFQNRLPLVQATGPIQCCVSHVPAVQWGKDMQWAYIIPKKQSELQQGRVVDVMSAAAQSVKPHLPGTYRRKKGNNSAYFKNKIPVWNCISESQQPVNVTILFTAPKLV